MRPIKIEFQAFGPYSGREEVDFEKLSSKGLFLICGKTGIGKTMILDAMTFALYGLSSGDSRNDFSAMRCTKADFDITTYVKFTFENNGEYYIFERRLERKRKNLSPQYNVMRRDVDGVYKPLFENAKDKLLNEKAREIIGLDYNQFRQVIVLPQGQFERLLTSESADKEKILTNIFGEQKWQAIADRLYDEVFRRREELKTKKDRILTSLREENCETLNDLVILLESKNHELEDLTKSFEEADYDEKNTEIQRRLALVKRFGDLKKTVDRQRALSDEKEHFDELALRVSGAVRAGKVRKYLDAVDEAQLNYSERVKQEEEAKRQADKAGEECTKIEKLYENLVTEESLIEDKKALIVKYEEKRAVYAEIDSVRSELTSAQNNEKTAMTGEQEASKGYKELSEAVEDVKQSYDTLNAEHTVLLNKYLAGIQGELASKLEEGEPCPVCGSTLHPHKAEITVDSVSKEDVQEKKAEVDSAYKKLNDVILRQEEAKNHLDLMHKQAEECRSAVAAITAKYENMQGNLAEGINSLKELNSTVSSLNKEIDEYLKKKKVYEESAKEKRDAYTTAKAKIEPASLETSKAKEQLDEVKRAAQDAIEENGFESVDEVRALLLSEAEVDEINGRISDYKANVAAAIKATMDLQKELEGIEEPDASECNKELEEISKAKSEYSEKKGILTAEINRLNGKKTALESEGENIGELIRQAEEDFVFAKKLRGDSGTGLQRYVLGIMFSSVVAAANKMLEMVHGGRYRLYRSDDKVQGTNKRGLELKVFDRLSENHEGRFVNTLSGGEKFLVSLALSIGLSTVAVGTGIRIEALFIDEGFGSLDEDSISDAMDILNSIQAANGLVGIISHVGLLQDRIPTKLKVVSDEKGSHILQTIG